MLSVSSRNDEGTWDTPDAAKLLMRTVAAAHGPALEAMPWSFDENGELAAALGVTIDNLAALIQGSNVDALLQKFCPCNHKHQKQQISDESAASPDDLSEV